MVQQAGTDNGTNAKTVLLKKWGDLGNIRGLIVGLTVLVIIFAFKTHYFLEPNNLIAISDQVTTIGILSLGMTFVILSGGIDLGVGSIVAMSGVLMTYFMRGGLGLFPAIILGILICTLLGTLTGVVITRFSLQPFIVTLGTMGIARGVAMVMSDASPITQVADGFQTVGSGRLGVVPYAVIIFVGLIIIAGVLLKKTKFGEYTFAIGGNEEAARLAGIPTNRYKILIYTLSGLLAGFTGYLLASKFNSGVPTVGQGYELDAIAAVVIGGTALSGGIGGIGGTILGILIMGVLNNGLNLAGVSAYWQYIIKGLLIIIAVVIDSYTRGKR